MSEARIKSDDVQAISDWLLARALGEDPVETVLEGFCERLVAAGMPLMRGHIAVRTLHPLIKTVAQTWRRGAGVETLRLRYETAEGPEWRRSPLFALLESRTLEARYRLEGPGEWSGFPFLSDLRSEGATDYLAIVTPFGDPKTAIRREDGIVCSWATDRAGGFDDGEIAVIRRLQPRLAVVGKVAKRERTAIAVAAAYLGADAGRRVLEGGIRRGDGDVIDAVLWYSDMRDSTPLADRLSVSAFLGLLDRYFECTAGAVLDQGGQVLRFIGDAVLAVFPYASEAGAAAAAGSAIAAAREAAVRAGAANRERSERGEPAFRYGLGLHAGEVLYGNIGVPERLEFTVVGRAANEVARLEGLTKELGESVIVSADFARLVAADWRSCGRHRLRGTASEMEIFALPDAALAAPD